MQICGIFDILSEDRLLAVGGEGGLAEVLVGERGGFAATRGAFDEAFFDEVRFIDVLDGAGVFAHGGCNRIESDRSTTELIDDGQQEFVIDLIEAEGIDIECFEGVLGDLEVDLAVTFDLREVTYASQECVRYTGRTTRTTGNLTCGFLIDFDVQESCGALDDTGEDVGIVVLEMAVDTKSRTER